MRTPLLGFRRIVAGAALAVVGLPSLTAALAADRDHLSLATPVLLMLVLVVAVALIGGLWPAVPAALVGAFLLNYYFVPPLHRLTIADGQDVVVILVYLAVAVATSFVVAVAERRRAQAARSHAEAQALSSVAGGMLSADETLPLILQRVRSAFGAHAVSLRDHEGLVVASIGVPEANDLQEVVSSGGVQLVLSGPQLFAPDRRVLRAFADAAATALQGRVLAEQASAAEEIDRLRTALLAAVGHDLRTPLAGVKASVTSLRSPDVQWSEDERDELLETIEQSADRLEALVSNLLDASRLQAGALSVTLDDVGLDEVVARALAGHPGRERVAVDVPESLSSVRTDAGLLERVLGNIVDNALHHDTGTIEVRARGHTIEVIDHGPGLTDVDQAFQPFQRLGDRSPGGVGLGLAVARGFIEALGGRLVPTTTPGGGLTMRIELA